MPSSKSRKNSKTPSKLSYPDQSSSRSSSSRASFSEEPETNEDDISASLLEEASIRYPLISKDAFVGRITELESNFGSNAAKIWLSESAMVVSSLVPGSTVSVSIASSKRKQSGGSPLESLIDELGWDCSIDSLDKRAGNFFALAVVFPSSKVAVYPRNVLAFYMSKPQNFKYKRGQYMFVNCSAISPFEWHSFSISSAPRDDYLSVHIRTLYTF